MRTRDLLEQLGPALNPIELLRLRADVVHATRTASRLYPTHATLHAELAQASAEISMIPDAVREAREALRLDRLTPHLDKKLPDDLRKRLEAQLPAWEQSASDAETSATSGPLEVRPGGTEARRTQP